MGSNNKATPVTGAGTGIGKHSRPELHREGYQVVLTGRHECALEETTEGAGDDGERALVVTAEVDLTGALLYTQEAFKIMKDQNPMGGRIFNNDSVSAAVLRLDSAPYNATKHPFSSFTESTALDGCKYDIACG